MKIYITKHAHTRGILEANAEIQGDMATVRLCKSGPSLHYMKNEWFYDFDSARKRAEAMRDKRIMLIKKEADKLAQKSYLTYSTLRQTGQ